jgi:hypothetical protein
MRALSRCLAAIISLSLCPECSLFFEKAAEAPAVGESPRNQGYSLLYGLVSQQKDVDKLLLIKGETSEVQTVIKKIAAATANATARLEEFAKKDSSLELEVESLPVPEQKTRSAIESSKTKSLLFSGGSQFEVRLLLSQAEGMSYGGHLAEVVSGLDSDPQRKQYFSDLSVEFLKLHDAVLDILDQREVARRE